MEISKKIIDFILGIVCCILAPLFLAFMACPFFHIEGNVSHGVLDEYLAPGNFFLIILNLHC